MSPSPGPTSPAPLVSPPCPSAGLGVMGRGWTGGCGDRPCPKGRFGPGSAVFNPFSVSFGDGRRLASNWPSSCLRTGSAPSTRGPADSPPLSPGGFSDSDLLDGTSGGEGELSFLPPPSPGPPALQSGVVPGIVGAVVVAVAGAISSFIAYQKKKLCFKENAGQGEVDLENRAGTNAEPPGKEGQVGRPASKSKKENLAGCRGGAPL
uniref:CD99 antigen n=1 Tax=Urocitellus parryii TaxID=9999 RepID=A0A8D2ICK5_UROPR